MSDGELGPYRLVEKLGDRVWKAWDPKRDRWVAVQEARLDGPRCEVRHPHLAEVLDAGPGWLTLTLVEGRPLDRAGHDYRSAAAALADVAGAVQALHDAGWIHHAIQPGNIVQDVEGRAILSAPTLEGPATPYTAPEREKGPPADVYALGATLYHLACGVSPAAIATRATRGVPAPLAAILARAMETRPEDRYASAAALADDLRRFLRGERTSKRPFRLARWIVVAALAAAAVAVWALKR